SIKLDTVQVRILRGRAYSMKQVLCVLALLVVAFSAMPAYAAADVSGMWDVDGNVYGNQVTYTFTVKQEGDKLTGSAKFVGQDKETPVTGMVADKQVTWQFDVPYQGQTYTLVYTATLASDTAKDMAGKITVAGIEGQFTAKKHEAQ